MRTTLRILVVVVLAVVAVYRVASYRGERADARAAERAHAGFNDLKPQAWQLEPSRLEEESAFLEDAARRAWSYVERHYQDDTGLVLPVPSYPVATLWDIASGLAALYCASALGLLAQDEYDRRTDRALRTLREMPMFDDGIYNKVYRAADASMADRDGAASRTGYGWSAIDLGRLLVWLKIIATQRPQFAGDIDAIVERIDVRRAVAEGYLHGGELNARRGPITYQEGRIGYEQYAAHGFAMWGLEVTKALDFTVNTAPVTVLGVALIQDRRPRACLTSEPLILTGLEVGWNEQAFRVGLSLLAAQRERYMRTGIVTIVSEDASDQPPHYFYYYCAILDDAEFAVTAQGHAMLRDGPRTISTKAAFAWYALSPNAYTRLALEAVTTALAGQDGWPAGVMEAGRTAAGPENLNTAAVILESALYAKHRKPLILPSAAES